MNSIKKKDTENSVDNLEYVEPETWKDIEGYGGWYQASNKGRIRSFRADTSIGDKRRKNPIIMSGAKDKDGYILVSMSMDLNTITKRAHRLIAETFIPNPENKSCINHKNGVKDDNRVANLEWATQSENVQHAFDNGFRKPIKGNKKLTRDKVKQIKILLRDTDLRQIDIAEKYDVSQGTIQAINVGKTWKDVKI